MRSKMEEELEAGRVEGKEEGAEAAASGALGAQEEEESPITLVESRESNGLNPVAMLEGEVSRWKDLALRSQAELDNFRKRMAREKSDAIRYGNAALLESLLPVLDNFSFGLEAARREAGLSVVFQGMSMVGKQLSDLLEEFGVQEVAAEGLPFDPNLHEAVQQRASQEVEEGHVISVIRKGYRLHDRLLRAANVIVSCGPAESSETESGLPQSTDEAPASPKD